MGELKDYVYRGNFSFLKSLINFSDMAITVSKGYLRNFHNFFDGIYHGNKLCVVENGMDFATIGVSEPLTVKEIRGRQRGREKPILTIASRLVKEKGIESIMNALPQLTESFEVHIAGRGDYDVENRLRTSQQVHYHGHIRREEVLKLLKKTSVFLAPYTDLEPFGIVPIEALACGSIPIVSAVGGMVGNFKDIESDPKNGNAIVISEINNDSIKENKDFSEAILKSAKRAHLCVSDPLSCFAGVALV